ncbi:MAG: hypothetical protein J0L64_11095 [Acidobacteria bacterium]|nr:hypothetical protein [Acidobacteriota bacterium]
MEQSFAGALAVVLLLNLVLLLVLLYRSFAQVSTGGQEIREELRAARQESNAHARELREELSSGARAAIDSVEKGLEKLSQSQQAHRSEIAERLNEFQGGSLDAFERVRTAMDEHGNQTLTAQEREFARVQQVIEARFESVDRKISEAADEEKAAMHERWTGYSNRPRKIQSVN